ncbi:chromosome partitioning protein, partial [Nonomuraea diastatica]
MHRPLVITEDHALLDDLVRIAAAAGAQLDVAHVPA